jgi:hypothetical protein
MYKFVDFPRSNTVGCLVDLTYSVLGNELISVLYTIVSSILLAV